MRDKKRIKRMVFLQKRIVSGFRENQKPKNHWNQGRFYDLGGLGWFLNFEA